MTRRKFIQKLISALPAAIVGLLWLAKKIAPRKFIWAARVKKYPGSLRALQDITEQGKWSG